MNRKISERVHEANPLQRVVPVVWQIFLIFLVAGTLLGLVIILAVALLWTIDLKTEKDIS
jgi:hypothetical protein